MATHRERAGEKLGLRSRAELVRWPWRKNWSRSPAQAYLRPGWDHPILATQDRGPGQNLLAASLGEKLTKKGVRGCRKRVLYLWGGSSQCTAPLNLDHLTGQFSQGSHPLSTGCPQKLQASGTLRPSADACGCTPQRRTPPPMLAPPPESGTPAGPPTPQGSFADP